MKKLLLLSATALIGATPLAQADSKTVMQKSFEYTWALAQNAGKKVPQIIKKEFVGNNYNWLKSKAGFRPQTRDFKMPQFDSWAAIQTGLFLGAIVAVIWKKDEIKVGLSTLLNELLVNNPIIQKINQRLTDMEARKNLTEELIFKAYNTKEIQELDNADELEVITHNALNLVKKLAQLAQPDDFKKAIANVVNEIDDISEYLSKSPEKEQEIVAKKRNIIFRAAHKVNKRVKEKLSKAGKKLSKADEEFKNVLKEIKSELTPLAQSLKVRIEQIFETEKKISLAVLESLKNCVKAVATTRDQVVAALEEDENLKDIEETLKTLQKTINEKIKAAKKNAKAAQEKLAKTITQAIKDGNDEVKKILNNIVSKKNVDTETISKLGEEDGYKSA